MIDSHSTSRRALPGGQQQKKVAVVGMGEVGSSFAFALTMKGTVREMALINRSRKKAEGEAMDLNHCHPFVSPVDIRAGGYEECQDAQVVVITAGVSQEPGESRMDLTRKNADIMRKIIPDILRHNPDPIILMVTNPVDVLTYVALKISGLPQGRVFGSGTVLDTSRFRSLLARRHGIDARNVHGYIIGEHGDSEMAIWSRVNIAGIPVAEYCPICERRREEGARSDIVEQVRQAAYQIIERKGATSYAIALALTHIVNSVLRDQKSVLTVSSLLGGEYGVTDVCLSLPRIVGKGGVEKTLSAALSTQETKAFHNCARVVRSAIREAGF